MSRTDLPEQLYVLTFFGEIFASKLRSLIGVANLLAKNIQRSILLENIGGGMFGQVGQCC